VRWVFDEGEFEGCQGEEAVEGNGGDGCQDGCAGGVGVAG